MAAGGSSLTDRPRPGWPGFMTACADWLRFGEPRGGGTPAVVMVCASWGRLAGEGWWMTSIERTAYPQFRRLTSARVRHVYFTPAAEEIG